MTKSNNADAFKVHNRMMIISGIWPTKTPNLLHTIRSAISYSLVGLLGVTMWIQVIHVITDFTELSEILYIMVTVTASLIKQASFNYHKKTFLDTIDFLKNPIFVSYPDDLDHYMATTIKYSTIIANCYRYLIISGLIMFGVYPVVDNKPLPFPFTFDLDIYSRIFMYVLQLTGITCCAWNNSSMDLLCSSLMGVAAAQFDILAGKIMHINTNLEDKTDKQITITLKQCVEHHLAIMSFVKRIEKVFSFLLLVQFLASAIVICNTLFHLVLISISSQFFMLAIYFLIMMMELSMYCWYGNEIILTSVRVGDACYKFNWYICGNEVRKYLFIIMERSKRPLVITTMNFSKLSLATLTSILQWSYSCLALLMKMYQKRKVAH